MSKKLSEEQLKAELLQALEALKAAENALMMAGFYLVDVPPQYMAVIEDANRVINSFTTHCLSQARKEINQMSRGHVLTGSRPPDEPPRKGIDNKNASGKKKKKGGK